MPKNSFILQARLNTIVAKLTDAQAGVLFKSILNYAENGSQANFDDSGVAIAFEFVKQDIDYNNAKYAEVCERNANNGRKGGAPKGNQNAQKQPKTSETTQNKRPLEKQPKTSETTQNKHNDVDNDVDNDVEIDNNNNNKTPLPPLKGKESLDFVSAEFKPIFQKWLDYKREKKQTYKSKLSLQQCYKQLLELSNNNATLAEKVVNQSIANNWAGLFPLKDNANGNGNTPKDAEIRPILEFMLTNYEEKGLAQNPTLKARYVKQWTKTADDLVSACGGDLELAKKMITHYANKQTDEWYLWDVLNNFCGIYDELKRRNYVK